MLGLECNICCNLFDRNDHLPRIVGCGHTFCSECLSGLLQSSNACPTCKKIISNDTEISCDHFTVNYFVLEVKDERQMQYSSEDFVDKSLKRLLKLRMDYSKLKTTIKERLDLNLEMIVDAEKSMDKMLENHNPFDKDYLEEIKKLKQSLENVRREVIPSTTHRDEEVSTYCENYDSISLYLSEIYKGILEGKKFAAVTKINDKLNYAKLSIRDNILFLHAFEEAKIDEDHIITVGFHDFVDAFLVQKVNIESASTSTASKVTKISSDIFGFLDLTYGSEGYYRRVFIDILSSASHLGSQFLKYCSGEEGYSYKGLEYQQRLGDAGDDLPGLKYSGLKVDRLIQNKDAVFCSELSVARYLQKKNNTLVNCDFDTHYLRFEDDGCFEILKFQLLKRATGVDEESIFCPNNKGPFGSLSNFLNPTSLSAFNFANSSAKFDSTTALGVQNAGSKSDSGFSFGLLNASTESDSKSAELSHNVIPNSSTESDSKPINFSLNFPNSSANFDPISSLKCVASPSSGLVTPSKRPVAVTGRKKDDRNLGHQLKFQNFVPATDSNINKMPMVPESSSLKPDPELESQISSPHSIKCIKSPPKISNIVGSILDHEKNFYETFAGAEVRSILDCGIAFKL